MVRLLQSLALPLGHVAVVGALYLLTFPLTRAFRPGALCCALLRVREKIATILTMDENEKDLPPEAQAEPVPVEPPADDELSTNDDTLILPTQATVYTVDAEDDRLLSEMEVDAVVVDAEDDVLLSEMEADAAVTDDEPAPVVTELPPADDWMVGDIDAALAAVASLSEIMPEREAEAEIRADARRSAPAFVPGMAMPPLATLKRGQFGSLVPALLLIAFGAWLTLTTTAGTSPDPVLVLVIVAGGIIVTLLAQWLGTGRWSRGLFFFALLVLLVAGVIAFALQPTGLDVLRTYPLLLVSLGLAMGLAGLLARPFNARLTIPGGLFVVAGVVGMAVTMNAVPANLLSAAALLAPVVLGIVVLLWLLPLIFRRR